jgi:taurine--2-oxoglutarate transaminase
VTPDMITFAKGVTSAYAPLAGVVANDALAEFVRSDDTYLGQTFGGHPVACAAGLGAMDEYRDGLFQNVTDLAPILEERLRSLERHDVVGDVRGRGFLWAIEFTDPETGNPFVDPRVSDEHNPVDDVIEAAQDRGLLLGSGRPGFQIIIAPPFCIDESDIDEAVETLETAIETVFS